MLDAVIRQMGVVAVVNGRDDGRLGQSAANRLEGAADTSLRRPVARIASKTVSSVAG
ncbi:hypothetical protein [Nocardia sp. NBC_00511]|uniref:hypothetical protein n=1 Tax=Nocardia sp. NBC_00511 TaxID=2903591 RepID=UPI0030E3CFE8